MRKIFTALTIAALSASAMMAQGVNFKVQDKVYESGATVTVMAEALYFDYGDGPELDGFEAEPHLYVIPTEDGKYFMSMEMTEADNDAWSGMWCGVGNGGPIGSGVCKNFKKGDIIDDSKSGNPCEYNLAGGTEYDTVLHFALGLYEAPKEVTSCTTVIKAWKTGDEANPSVLTLIAKYDPNGAAVGTVEGDNVKFSSSEIYAPGMEIQVYNLNDARVLSARGNASLSSLPAGIYVAKAGNTVKKMIVR